VKRTAFGEAAGASLLALGAPAGRPYQSFGWEVWAPFQPLYEAGKYAEVADAARTMVETPPRYPDSLYNLACCEALAGRPADALAHLRESIELADRLKSFADGDSDFDSLRDDPGFKAIVG
jgi:tetratricopeptide (TPR) repeat protein